MESLWHVLSARTHGANAVAGAQGARESAAALQCRADNRRWRVELVPDGLADRGHVREEHDRDQAGDVHRNARHRAGTLPAGGAKNKVRQPREIILTYKILKYLNFHSTLTQFSTFKINRF